MKRSSTMILAAASSLLAGVSLGADAGAGKTLFAQRCTVCHTAEAGDNGGAQGPSLIGIMGRAAGSAAQFSYTAALRDSKLTWDPATLKRFLASPSTV
ncbi:MAG TPA: c-type cytochrome, partial [Steroidobacteraceae bacterium]|nr:c-type cytochrome [Steroidobacteraceae bacterium]